MSKILLLFGASGNLGKAAAQVFSNKDYDKLYFFASDIEKLETFNDKTVLIQSGDLTKEEEVEKVFSKIEKSSQSEFFMFNTIGGFYGEKYIHELDYKNWLKMMDLNLNSAFLLSKYFSKLMQDSAGGSICFTSSISADHHEAQKSAYNISKNALNFLIKVLALEGRDLNFSANGVAPYIIDTPENRKWIIEERKLTDPAIIAEAVNHLFEGWKTITGTILKLYGNRQ